jgi:hypothetical protein
MLIHDRFFMAVNAAAVALALSAAMVNAFVGPLNAAMWLAPVFMAGVAVITYLLLQGVRFRAERPFALNWVFKAIMGKRLGTQVASFLDCSFRWSMRSVSPVFLYFVPSILLILAAALLVAAIRGQITPGG